jgi:hypothetical protein
MHLKSIRRFALCAALAALPALAHHSFSAEFDDKKSVTVKGEVVKVEWANPHIWFYVDAKDENGAVQHWQFEGGPPNMLTRAGWKKDTLKIGETVTATGYRAKDGTNTASAREVTLADGRKVFNGTAAEVGERGK